MDESALGDWEISWSNHFSNGRAFGFGKTRTITCSYLGFGWEKYTNRSFGNSRTDHVGGYFIEKRYCELV